MTRIEKLARRNIKNCISFEIGECENTLLDYPEDDNVYIKAKNFIENHEAIVKYIYKCSVFNLYLEGGVFIGSPVIGQIKFLGQDKLLDIVEELVSKEGY